MKPKVMLVFGVRSDAIKMAPVVKELKQSPEFDTLVVVTGQHIEMLDEVLEVFQIHPDYNFRLMRKCNSMIDFISKALGELEKVVIKEKPDLILVHGDTNTSVAASLTGIYSGITVGHVEGGLRSEDKFNPYPEEINRRIDDIISEIYYVPTEGNKKNLLFKDYNEDNIFITGNTCIDALFDLCAREIQSNVPILQELYQSNNRIITVTAHRRENWGKPLIEFFSALQRIVKENPDVRVVYPVHLNPNVKNIADRELVNENRIILLEPLNYLEFVNLMKQSYLIITDSGGIQEEAPALGVPVLVIRENTERWEAVEAGTVRLVGLNQDVIVSEANLLLNSNEAYEKMSRAINPYGDGRASFRIVEHLKYFFGLTENKPPEFLLAVTPK